MHSNYLTNFNLILGRLKLIGILDIHKEDNLEEEFQEHKKEIKNIIFIIKIKIIHIIVIIITLKNMVTKNIKIILINPMNNNNKIINKKNIKIN